MTPAAPRAYTRMCVRVCVRKAVHFCTLHPLNTKARRHRVNLYTVFINLHSVSATPSFRVRPAQPLSAPPGRVCSCASGRIRLVTEDSHAAPDRGQSTAAVYGKRRRGKDGDYRAGPVRYARRYGLQKSSWFLYLDLFLTNIAIKHDMFKPWKVNNRR